jgi:predicted nuclease with TOPRIM domain
LVSSSENPEFAALRELEDTIKHVCDELAAWRRRALKAEGDREELGGDHDVVGLKERILSLEEKNAELQRRLDNTRGRVQDLMKRLRFLEEQATAPGPVR